MVLFWDSPAIYAYDFSQSGSTGAVEMAKLFAAMLSTPDMMFESFRENDPFGDMEKLGIREMAVSAPVLSATVEDTVITPGTDSGGEEDGDQLVVQSLDYDEEEDVAVSLPSDLIRLSMISIALIGDPYVEVYVNDTYVDQGAQLTSLVSDRAVRGEVQVLGLDIIDTRKPTPDGQPYSVVYAARTSDGVFPEPISRHVAVVDPCSQVGERICKAQFQGSRCSINNGLCPAEIIEEDLLAAGSGSPTKQMNDYKPAQDTYKPTITLMTGSGKLWLGLACRPMIFFQPVILRI